MEHRIAMMHARAYLMQGRTWREREMKCVSNRFTMEAVVDAYDSSERAMGWYYYLHVIR